jgi:hypothetical protein
MMMGGDEVDVIKNFEEKKMHPGQAPAQLAGSKPMAWARWDHPSPRNHGAKF